MKRYLYFAIVAIIICSISTLVACHGLCVKASEKEADYSLTPIIPEGAQGFQGMSYERKPDGGIGPIIPQVIITFVKENGSVTKKVATDNRGFYRISLSQGRYVVTATHPDYENYSTAPGFFVVTGTGYQTGNLFMKGRPVTTVLLIRHAERSNDSLSEAGWKRASELVHVAEKAGVKAIFATDTQRSQQTVQQLATKLNIQPVIYNYNDMQGLGTQVLSQHAGEVVLVAGHSDTVSKIVKAFGGAPNSCSIIGDEFDNLCIITIYGPGKVKVINLQYGEPSPTN